MIIIQPTLSEAVQLQPPGAVTLIVPVPPLGVNDLLGGEMEYVHDTPACVTVWLRPAAVITAVRLLVLVFAETV